MKKKIFVATLLIIIMAFIGWYGYQEHIKSVNFLCAKGPVIEN